MYHRLEIVLFAAIISLLAYACNTTKPLLSEIPAGDLHSRIYFYDYGLIDKGWKTRTIDDSISARLYTGGFDLTLLSAGKSAPFEPSISPFGRYLATHHDKVELGSIVRSDREIDFGIYDLVTNEFTADLATKVPFPDFEADAYHIQWSTLDSGFFYARSDTIRKCYPHGREDALLYHDGVRTFAVSPSEDRILFVRDDSVQLYDISQRSIRLITTAIRSNKRVRAVSWSLDGSRVAFVQGWKIYVYDIPGKSVTECKADGEVLWTQWLPDGTLVYTEGKFSYDMQVIKTTESFKICRLTPATGERSVLHERINHSPFTVRPRLSPSGRLLLFSEPKVNGGYEVKLMSLDGQFMNTICDGDDPCWGR